MTYNKDEVLSLFDTAEQFDDNIFHGEYVYDFINDINLDTSNYLYTFGASKLAIIPLKEDFVIKIPFTGTLYADWDENEWTDTYHDFEGADGGWDYCKREVERYAIAEKEGFAQCFAKPEFVGIVNGFKIYTQEKCITLDTKGSYHDINEVRKTSKVCSSAKRNPGISIYWLTDFRLFYGEDFLIKFINFLTENCWDDDLRDSNIGYLGTRPVLIDFSGYDS